MEKIEIYSNKLKTTFFIFVSLSLLISGICFYKIIFLNKSLFSKSILFLGFLLFVFGVIYSLFLLFRKSPLLIINDDEIVILNPFRKAIIIKFLDIQSFSVISNRFSGIASNRQILIELKCPTDKYQNTLYYKAIKKVDDKLANSQFGIQTSFLNIDYKDLLKTLNQRLKKHHLVTSSIK
jgi:hypothetical protein